jgi:DNA-binding LacI/PurR family transcriptional regulator
VARPRKKRKSTPEKQDIRTVAARAGVSIATVSRTINGLTTVGPDLAKRVWKAIEELNYFPNTQARGLVSGKSRIFGLVVSEITNPFFPELIQGFEDIAVAHGYEILIGSTNNDVKRMNICIRRMLERKVEGVAVMTFGMEEPLLQQLAERQVPLVLIDFHLDSPMAHTLHVDYRYGIREGVQHLAALGHREISFVSGPLRLHSARARKAAFLEAMEEIGIHGNLTQVVEGDHTLEGGAAAFERVAASGEFPTAIMCSNDMTAMGVMRAAHAAHFRIPDDLSLIGFDNIHFTEFTLPPMTTVEMSGAEIARRAFQALYDYVENARAPKPGPRTDITITTKLIVRQSTDFPRGTLPQGRAKRGKAWTHSKS